MISVFTPSHDPVYLDEAYASLVAQTERDWEWVIVLNGGANWKGGGDDPRVKKHRVTGKFAGVGALKAHAVAKCEGEILVELDHDDLLAPTCLQRVRETITDQVGFVYSDWAQIDPDGSPNLDKFDLRHGWDYDEREGYLVPHAMAPLPHNLSLIWYAPNHVRAFTRDAYDKAGGYDETRVICDDQDIMCRLYEVTEFEHIPELLYFQRIHKRNTQKVHNARIQDETGELYDRYVQRNALAWAARRELLALDLGAAHNKPDGYLGVDMHDADLVGDVFDVLGGLDDDSCGVIRAVDFLEHVADKIRLMNEIHRVLAHGGMLLSLTPSTDGRGAWQDPTHVSGWNENSWWYFTDLDYAKFVPEISARFQVSKVLTHYPSEWHRDHQIPYVQANVISLKDGPRNGGFLLWP